MNLRELAIQDHKAILGDTVAGFAQLLTITNPASVSLTVPGLASDVGEIVDPQTQLIIQARRATCTFDSLPLIDAGMGTIAAIADGRQRPWTVAFEDANGVSRVYKVLQVAPDKHIGSVRCELEAWRE